MLSPGATNMLPQGCPKFGVNFTVGLLPEALDCERGSRETDIAVFWDVTPCSLADMYTNASEVEAGSPSMTLICAYQTTWRRISEDRNVNTDRLTTSGI
jgi:hypothetical protein